MEELLKKYDDVTIEIARGIIELAKINHTTWRETKLKINDFERKAMFNDRGIDKYEYLFKLIYSLLEKEMNDLPLTNRSNSSL